MNNKTLNIYKKLITITLLIYVAIIQIVIACVPGDLINNLLLYFLNSETPLYAFFSQITVSTFINILLFGSSYLVLYSIINIIYKQIWKVKNKDCYLEGRWYHIHTREHNNSYIRCGFVDIKQNYYDLSVEGSNFHPNYIDTENNWAIDANSDNITYWDYDIVNLDENGRITAGYTANKITGSTRSNRGIHTLRVLDHGKRGYPTILGGNFSDIAPSTSEGHIRLYRSLTKLPLSTKIRLSVEKKIKHKKNWKDDLKSDETNNELENYSYNPILSKGPFKWKRALNILLMSKNHSEEKMQQFKLNDITPDDATLSHWSSIIIDIVKEAGELILVAGDGRIESIEKTSFRDVYTAYDTRVQELLIRKLSEIFVGSHFLAEELGWGDLNKLPDGYCFIIDPIDGTSNFTRNYKHSCVSVALAKNGVVIIGVVYDPYLNEVFHAVKGQGAYLGNEKIKCSNASLKKSIVGFGTSPYNDELNHETFAFSEMVFNNCNDLRRSGSSALDICYVACSRLDFFYELSLFPWDYGASGLIATEAGARITDFDENPLSYIKKCSVACGGIFTFDEFIKIRREFEKSRIKIK